MFQSDYRREMERLTPGSEALERLDALLAGGGERAARPRRRFGRRAAVALALCAALGVTAVAAGPTLWQALQVRLGAFAPYAAPAEGAVVESGVEVALAGSLSDGYVARVYFSVTDPAGRLNEHTNVTARLETADGPLAGGAGCHVLSWDAEAGRLLVEANLVGVGSGSAATLTVTGLDPSYRYETGAAFFPPERAQTLETEEAAEGQAVLRAGQTPQASPATEDFSISSMGFDGEGRFHIRLAMAEGFSNSGLLALPYNAAGEQMGSTQDRVDTADGTDYVIGGITPADVADMAYIRVYGVYHGPEEPIQATWTLPVALEPAEERTLTLDRTAGPYRLDALELSPLSIALTWRRTDGEVGHPGLQVTLRDGAQAALEAQGGAPTEGASRDFWVFAQPVELADIASITIAGETFPIN